MPEGKLKELVLILVHSPLTVNFQIMNRYLVPTYLLGVPIVALVTLYELGSAYLWLGYPFVWVRCLEILIAGPAHGQCGYYFDSFALVLDVLFYTGWGYALLGCYKLFRRTNPSARRS